MRTVVCTLLALGLVALCGLLFAPPPAEAGGRRGGVVVTYTYRTHYYYVPGRRSSGTCAPQPDLSILAPPPPTPLTYHWLGTAGADSSLWILFRGTDQIGEYNLPEDVYRRRNTDGTFSAPAPRPWRTNADTVPQPPPVAAKQQAKAKEVAARVAEERTREEQERQSQAAGEQSSVTKVLQQMPPWSIYAAGGGLAALAAVLGLAVQGRRR